MSLTSRVLAAPDFFRSAFFMPAFLRIAVPARRAAGIGRRPEAPEAPAPVSREELQALFKGELMRGTRTQTGLTAREAQEVTLAGRLRRALYPARGLKS